MSRRRQKLVLEIPGSEPETASPLYIQTNKECNPISIESFAAILKSGPHQFIEDMTKHFKVTCLQDKSDVIGNLRRQRELYLPTIEEVLFKKMKTKVPPDVFESYIDALFISYSLFSDERNKYDDITAIPGVKEQIHRGQRRRSSGFIDPKNTNIWVKRYTHISPMGRAEKDSNDYKIWKIFLERTIRREVFFQILCGLILAKFGIIVPHIVSWSISKENLDGYIEMESIQSLLPGPSYPLSYFTFDKFTCENLAEIVDIIGVHLKDYGIYHNDIFNSSNLFSSKNKPFTLDRVALIDFGETAFDQNLLELSKIPCICKILKHTDLDTERANDFQKYLKSCGHIDSESRDEEYIETSDTDTSSSGGKRQLKKKLKKSIRTKKTKHRKKSTTRKRK